MRVILEEEVLELVHILQSIERLLLRKCAVLVSLIPASASSVTTRHTIRVHTRIVRGLVPLPLLHLLLFLYCWLLQSECSLRLVASAGAGGRAVLTLLLLARLLGLQWGESFLTPIDRGEGASVGAVVQLTSCTTC